MTGAGRALCLCTAAASVACAGNPDPPPPDGAVLADLVGNVMLPTLRAFDAGAAELAKASADLDAAPDQASLDAVQDAWRAARKPWRQADAFRFGPVVTLELEGPIDWWPAKPETIEATVAGSETLDTAAVDGFGSAAKGFMALEYLLFDAQGGDEAVLAALAGDPGNRRRLLVKLLAEDLRDNAGVLLAAWEPAGGNFAKEITGAGETSATFATPKAAVDEIVNQLVFCTDAVVGIKIGKPFGKQSGGEPQPDLEESPRSDNSIDDMLDTLRSVEDLYEGRYAGADALGISDIVRFRAAAIDDRARAATTAAFAGVEAMPPPFREAISKSPAEVEAAWQSVREMKRVLGTDVVGALGVTLKFSDNDGD